MGGQGTAKRIFCFFNIVEEEAAMHILSFFQQKNVFTCFFDVGGEEAEMQLI